MTVEEMTGLDLGYAPPFSPVWDPVLVAARAAAAKLRRRQSVAARARWAGVGQWRPLGLFLAVGLCKDDADCGNHRRRTPAVLGSHHADRHARGLCRDARPRQGRRVRLSRDQRDVVAVAERGAARVSPRPAATASCRSRPAARSTCPARRSRTWWSARCRWRSSRTTSRRATPSTSRCTRTTARRTSSTATCARSSRSRRSGWPRAWSRSSSRTCGTARRSSSRRTSRSPQELLDECAKARIVMELEIGVVGRRGGRRRQRDQREALHDAGRRAAHRRGARHR